jgi:hypothetical protein
LTKPVEKLDISLSKWAAKMLSEQDRLVKAAQKQQRSKDEKNLAKRAKYILDIPIGSYVLVEYHSTILKKGPPNKFNTQLRGPFKVLRRNFNTIIIWNSLSRKEEEVIVTLCHPFLFNEKKVDPEDIARRDEISAHMVESVKAHSGEKKIFNGLPSKLCRV